MSHEAKIRSILDGKDTPERLTKVADERETLQDKDLADFDRTLERILNEIRNPPSKTTGPTLEERCASAEQVAKSALEIAHRASKELAQFRSEIEAILQQDASGASFADRLQRLLGRGRSDPSVPASQFGSDAGSTRDSTSD